jgi:hypothetical protein
MGACIVAKRTAKVAGPAHPPLVLAVWEDAHTSGIELVTLDSVKDNHRPEVMQTVGWLIRDDDKGISVANERCSDNGEDYYRGHTFILRSLVRSVTPFTLSRPRKKVPHAEVGALPPA